jgi:hypothetical protein
VAHIVVCSPADALTIYPSFRSSRSRLVGEGGYNALQSAPFGRAGRKSKQTVDVLCASNDFLRALINMVEEGLGAL